MLDLLVVGFSPICMFLCSLHQISKLLVGVLGKGDRESRTYFTYLTLSLKVHKTTGTQWSFFAGHLHFKTIS